MSKTVAVRGADVEGLTATRATTAAPPDADLVTDEIARIDLEARTVDCDPAAEGEGDLLTPPALQVTLREPSTTYPEEKQQPERDWLAR